MIFVSFTYFFCASQSCICLEQRHQCLASQYFQLPLRTSKYFKPLQRQHYANEAELEKPLKCSPPEDRLHLMVLCQLPSMTILQWVALCWAKAYSLRLLWIFVSLKAGSVRHWTLLFTLRQPAEGDHHKHLQKIWFLCLCNSISKITAWDIACLFEACWGLVLHCWFTDRFIGSIIAFITYT